MVYAMLFVFGLCLGSFVNALIWRIHEQAALQEKQHKLNAKERARLQELSISKGRSMCLSCGHELAAKDLIPVLSWLSLRGKCRYCGARIPDSPVAEITVPVLFVVSYLWWPLSLDSWQGISLFVIWLMCLVAFVALALYDLRWYLLPDRITFPLMGLSTAFVLLHAVLLEGSLAVIAGAGVGVFVVAGLFYALFQLSGGAWIGGGDVKLGVALGMLAGGFLGGLMVILFASLLGLAGAAIPRLRASADGGKAKIPFGPFLLAATVIVVLFGVQIGDWYTNLLIV
jgi:leader peptidase (prepilin peptidase)/N-methyltransferase